MGFSKLTEGPSRLVAQTGAFIANPFGLFDVSPPLNFSQKSDFNGGFTMTPIRNGKEVTEDTLRLVGNYMPMVPFTWGGELRSKRDYYAGNPEPVTQVLGTMESDLIIRGRMHSKDFKSKDLREVPSELTRAIEDQRLRGELLVFKLGDWKRYGYLKKTKFDMKSLADISYELTFEIVGFFLPRNIQVIDDKARVPFEINTALIAAYEEFYATYSVVPESTPGSLIDLLNDAISDVASAIANVTNFIDTVVTAAEDAAATYQRALGAARFAMVTLYRFRQRLSFAVSSSLISTNDFLSMAQKYKITTHFTATVSSSRDLSALMEQIRSRFANLVSTLPAVRHLVQSGDTLQKISLRYFGTQDNWKKIYDHNKLSSTVLAPPQILEIPRL